MLANITDIVNDFWKWLDEENRQAKEPKKKQYLILDDSSIDEEVAKDRMRTHDLFNKASFDHE